MRSRRRENVIKKGRTRGNLHLTIDGDRDGDPHWSTELSPQGPNEEQKEGDHEKGSQGFLPCGKFKFLPPPSRSRKVSIQTEQDPKKPVHADKTRPSAIVNGFSVSPHVSHIQRIWFDHMLVQSQSSWPW